MLNTFQILRAIFALMIVLASSLAWPGGDSPVGLWKSIDDVSGKPKALIRIREESGALQGTIEQVFPQPGTEASPTCKACEGENKDMPVVGLTILTGLVREGEEYTDGHILDPENGKVYRSNARLIENGNKLEVRGYIGMPVLGRSQTWIRQD